MRLNTPTFWYKEPSLKALALSPASLAYHVGHKIHQLSAKAYNTNSPVICIGGLIAGGSGKTPCALALLELIRNEWPERIPCFLTRGYGGSLQGPTNVDLQKHTHKDVGDEALILAQKAPTVISADRKKGAKYIEQREFDLILMDDGLQNPSLYKDIKIVVIDGAAGFGNKKLLPAGPLREPLKCGLQKADAIILIGEDQAGIKNIIPDNKTLFEARLEVSERWIADTKTPYIAFCGLGRPEKFKTTLEDRGLNIIDWYPFPDHYPYNLKDMQMLSQIAKENDARLITTEKDAMRLPKSFVKENPLDILPVQILWQKPEDVTAFLKEKL